MSTLATLRAEWRAITNTWGCDPQIPRVAKRLAEVEREIARLRRAGAR